MKHPQCRQRGPSINYRSGNQRGAQIQSNGGDFAKATKIRANVQRI
nr:unnamed protein product [Callosobruchus analis]